MAKVKVKKTPVYQLTLTQKELKVLYDGLSLDRSRYGSEEDQELARDLDNLLYEHYFD